MDRIEKELRKLTEKERKWVEELLIKLQKRKMNDIDIKKLRGTDNIFRARRGNIRIIYHTKNNIIFIIKIEKRREDTYRF